jgi:hypothetical protein
MRIRVADAASRSVLGILLIVLAGCSSSNPAGPSPGQGFDAEQFLRPGAYRFLVLLTPQHIPGCNSTASPQSLFFAMAAVVTVTRDGETWTVRSTTEADGNVELRLRRVGDSSAAGSRVLLISVEGSARGSALATFGAQTAQSASFGGDDSRLTGQAMFQGSAQGTATGSITLNSPIFGTFDCQAVSWTLVPAFAAPF